MRSAFRALCSNCKKRDERMVSGEDPRRQASNLVSNA